MSAPAVSRPAVTTVSIAWRKWLVPDFALVIALKTLLTCLLLHDGTRMLFRDSDAGWHIRTGEAILSGSGLPRTDPYSFLNSGQPWFAWEWIADVLMGGMHQWGGLAAVAVMFAVILAATAWLWLRLTWAVGGDFIIACVFALTTLSAANMHWLARPHVFSWIFLLLSVWFVEVARKPLTWRRAVGIFLFGALWANTHASFFFGPVMALVYAAGLCVTPFLWDENRDTRRIVMLLQSAAIAGAASLLNPYGWNLHRHVFMYLGNDEMLRHISEFRSYDFHAGGAWIIVLCLATAAAGAMLAFAQKNVARSLLIALFTLLALRSARGLPLLSLVVLPLANASIAAALQRVNGVRRTIRWKLDACVEYSRNLRRFDVAFGGLAWAPIVIAAAFACSQIQAVKDHSGFPAQYLPVDASRVVETLPPAAKILAPDQFGGYFIYRFNGARKVYFDGRSDFYGLAQTRAYLDLIEIHPEWRAQLNRFGFTHAVLPKGEALTTALQLIGWRKIHSDNLAIVLQKP